MPLAEAQSEWVADLLDGTAKLPSPTVMRREIAHYHRAVARRYVASKRHTIQVDFLEHLAEIKKVRRAG
jgi:glutaredoxin 2